MMQESFQVSIHVLKCNFAFSCILIYELTQHYPILSALPYSLSLYFQGGAGCVPLQPQPGRQAPRRRPLLLLHHRLQGEVE